MRSGVGTIGEIDGPQRSPGIFIKHWPCTQLSCSGDRRIRPTDGDLTIPKATGIRAVDGERRSTSDSFYSSARDPDQPLSGLALGDPPEVGDPEAVRGEPQFARRQPAALVEPLERLAVVGLDLRAPLLDQRPGQRRRPAIALSERKAALAVLSMVETVSRFVLARRLEAYYGCAMNARKGGAR